MHKNRIAQLTHLGVIAVEGINAEKFLQGQLTCDVREISTTQSRFAAYCNHKGRVIASLRLFKFEEQYYLLLPQSILKTTLEKLKQFAVFSKTLLRDVSSEWNCIGYHGLLDLKEIPEQIDQVHVKDKTLFCRLHDSASRYLILSPTPVWDQFSTTAEIIDENTWRLLDIKAGISHIQPQTSELFTPHMIQLPELGGVSFNKGCYVGQEIVARTQYLGKAKRQLQHYLLNTEQNPQAGDSLYNSQNQTIGTLIDAASVSSQTFELLTVIQGKLAENETVFWNQIPLELALS